MFFIRDAMKTWELDSKHYFNYLAAYRRAGMGPSLVLPPQPQPFLSFPLFPSNARCARPLLLTKQASQKKKERSHIMGSLPFPNSPAITRPEADFPRAGSRAKGLLVWAAVSKRTTWTTTISTWIFTKGVSRSPTGVFEWNLSWNETQESFWRKH